MTCIQPREGISLVSLLPGRLLIGFSAEKMKKDILKN